MKENIIETVKYLELVNKVNSSDFHSFVHINKDVVSKSYSRFIWFTDTTLNLTIYNKSFQLVCTTDDQNHTQICCWGLLKDESEDGFNSFFGQLKKYLNYQPRFIVVDRGLAQIKSLNNIFPDSKKCYCHIHILRSLNKYFKGDLIEKIFKAHLYSQITIEEFRNYLEVIFKKNNIEIVGNESFYPEFENNDYNEINDVDDDNNTRVNDEIIENMNQIEKEKDLNREKHKDVFKKPSIEDLKKYTINNGKKCLIALYNEIDLWSPEILEPMGLYSYGNTNRVEGIFGNIKRLIHHGQLSITKLIDTMNYLHTILINRNDPKQLISSEIVDENNPESKQLNYYCIQILNSQYKLMNKKKRIKEGYHCRSCIARDNEKEYAWPCWHYMKRRQLKKEKYLVDFNDIPQRGRFSSETQLKFLEDNSLLINEEIELDDDCQRKNGVLFTPLEQVNNQYQRSLVDRKRKRKKPVNETIGFNEDEEEKEEAKTRKRKKITNDSQPEKRKTLER